MYIKTLIGLSAIALGLLPAVVLAQGGGDRGAPARGQAPAARGQPAPARGQTTAHAEVGNGHIPARGPAPTPKGAPPKAPAIRAAPDQTGHPAVPHVHAATDEWVGKDTGPTDPHYKLAQPWQHGHFGGEIGPQQVWRLAGGTPSRFSIGGSFFQVASYDVADCADWQWGSDDIILYLDPDHDGWYIAYNVRLGTFVHVTFLG